MKITKGSLCHLIRTMFGYKTDSDEFYAVLANTVSYVSRGTDYASYQDAIRPYCAGRSFSPKDFRLKLHSSEYFAFRTKLYVLRLGTRRALTVDDAKRYMREYGLAPCDAKHILRIWRDQVKLRKRVRDEVKHYKPDVHLNLALLKQSLGLVLKPVAKFAKSLAYRKLRFLCDSHNVELRDMQADLIIEAVGAYHKLMPSLKEPAHVVNYIKRSVTNRGLNIIEAGTSQKAGRLVSNKDKNGNWVAATLVVVSENQLHLGADGEAQSYEDLAGHNPMEEVEVVHSVHTVVSSVKPGTKKHRFLSILMGNDCPDFTEWLRVRKHATATETNSDVQEKLDPVRFNTLLGAFLRVDSCKVEAFLNKLRASFDPYMEQAA